HHSACAAQRGAGLRRGAGARGAVRQSLPLHRLHLDRRGRARRPRRLSPRRPHTEQAMRTVNSFIGSPVERLEDLRFLRGRGQYVDDLDRSDRLHAAILRSSVAHGRIRAIDAAAARALAGVHAVITAKELLASKELGHRVPRVPMRLQPLPDFEPFGQPVMAEAKVRYVGEAIALVLADSPAVAEDALGLIEVEIEPFPAGAPPPPATHRCCPRRPAAISPLSSTRCAATPRPPSRTRPMSGARASAPPGTWRCRWSPAGCWRNGMPRARSSRCAAAPRCCF